MSGYTKPCIFCKQEIKTSNDSSNWLAYNLDGSAHECRESVKRNDKPQVKQEQQKKVTLTLEDLDIRLKKIEALLNVED
jgi:hypothetical protein